MPNRPPLSIQYLITVLLVCLSLWLRLYNFGSRLTFGPEQAMSLLISLHQITSPSLLGQPYFRYTSAGHQLFTAPYFNWSLIPAIRLFSGDPLPITYTFAALNVLTGLLFFVLVHKHFGYAAAAVSFFLFAANASMIYHSLFIWILNYLPAVGLLNAYFLAWHFGLLKAHARKLPPLFLAGFMAGLGLGLEYFYLTTIIPTLIAIGLFSASKTKSLLAYVFGLIIAGSPMIAFDLRHRFYHTTTLWQYFQDTLASPSQSHLAGYHFLHLWPLALFCLSLLLVRLWSKSPPLTVALLGIYLYLNLSSPLLSPSHPVGMPGQTTLADLKLASILIASDAPEKFNVASLLDFDARAHTLRYLLETGSPLRPQSSLDYSHMDALYVMALPDQDPSIPVNFELQSFSPYTAAILGTINSRLFVYKLTR